MRAAETAALATGWTEEQLLDLAGTRLGHALGRFFPQSGSVIGYLGKGHNAGDTLVALRVLRDEYGWQIAARSAFAFGIKPGLATALGVQLAAAAISALLGLGISTLLRSSQDAYTASSVYLVACILITGLIYPIEQAAWGVIAVSYAFPLTLSGHPLEEWMLKGAGAALEPWRLAGLAAQLVGALALCALAVQRLRRSL